MITVTPIQSKAEQEALCRDCRVTYLPDALAYRAENEGAFIGMCQFSMDNEGGHVYDLAAVRSDADTLFLLGRAALNFIDLCGVHTACFEGTADEKLLSRIGFQKDGTGRWTVDLTNFFAHPCAHHPM